MDDLDDPVSITPSPANVRVPARGFFKNRALGVVLQPLLLLTAISGALLYVSWRIDIATQPKTKSVGFFDLLAHFDPERAEAVLGDVSQVVAQILGVAISVVAIIVELASNRYTHRITELFFRTRANFMVMGLFVIATLDGLWVSLMFRHDFAPMRSALVAMALMTVSALLLLPYFAYVFHFVNPLNFVARIRNVTLRAVTSAPRRIALAKDAAEDVQHTASDGAEQLSDVALNAMANHDGAIAIASVNALGDLGRDYLDVKGALPLDWFRITDVVTQNPDFVSMSRDMLEELSGERAWYEFKLLRQFQTIYLAGLGANRELCYVVAIRTRELAERAMDHADPLVAGLCIKFFNTYLRSTVNARDVRTAYNVLNQYRLLAEGALVRGVGHFAVEVARYFKYYGQLAFHADLGFILETAAYDLCALNELAFDVKATERAELLRIFLQVDKEGEGAAREASLRGVRKAQVKLATYYLLHGDESAAKEVFHDMREEKPARLASIRDEMLSINSPHFWEITDRGTNFDYIPPERKRRLVEFFEWFGGALAPPRTSLVPQPGATVPPPVIPSDGAAKPSSESASAATVSTPGIDAPPSPGR
jgi:hypothetical protein